MPNKILVITGPTATGKTKLGVLAAQKFNGEIISADSMQIYRGMDIGTAKVTDEEKQGIVHHMIDIIEPWESYSVARYVEEADKIIDRLIRSNKLPIIVGGTGLYIDSLIAGRTFAKMPEDEMLRTTLNEQYDSDGGEAMLERLKEFDPETGNRLNPADKKRIVRAFEVFLITGKTISSHNEETKKIPPKYDSVNIILSYKDREDLYDRINRRVDLMMEAGLTNEVEELRKDERFNKSTAIQAIGYKEIVEALNGQCSMEEAYEKIKQESRKYAKRQLTWFRRYEKAHWIEWDREPNYSYGLDMITKIL